MTENKVLTILIPAFNEQLTIAGILSKLDETVFIQKIQKEIIIINDCSSDDTEKVIFSYINSNPTQNIK